MDSLQDVDFLYYLPVNGLAQEFASDPIRLFVLVPLLFLGLCAAQYLRSNLLCAAPTPVS
jgi:hypothetical protein